MAAMMLGSPAALPVVDLAACDAPTQMRAALAAGCCLLRPTGAEPACEAALEALGAFFAAPDAACAGAARGYERRGDVERFRVGPPGAAPEGLAAADAAEAFAENRWPRDPNVRRALEACYAALAATSAAALAALEPALGLRPDALADACARPTSVLAANRYGAGSGVAVPAHTDVSLVTLVYARAGPGGLQVRRGRGFVDAPDGAGLVLTFGAALAAAAPRGEATSHRVLRGARARTSLVFFANPSVDATLGDGVPYRAWRAAWRAGTGAPDDGDAADLDEDPDDDAPAPRFVVRDGRLVDVGA